MEGKQAAKSVCAGAGAGFLSGLMGAGGGALLVPLLRDWAKLDAKQAMAASVFAVAPICAASAFVYSGELDWRPALPFMLGGLAGGIAGGFFFAKTSPVWLKRAFGALLLFGSVRQFIGWRAPFVWDGFAVSAAAGGVTGILSGMGLGGGALLMLWMTALGGLEQHAAQGVNLLYFLPCSAGAMAGLVRKKQIPWKPALCAAGAGLPLGLLGAWVASRTDAAPLRVGFGILTALIGLRELLVFPKQKTLEDQ